MRLSDIIPVNEDFFVWDAVVAWRDSIYKADCWKSTKESYLLNMLKLIEEGVINVRIQLSEIDEDWLKWSKNKVDELPEWSEKTKSVRKSCLNSFYKLIKAGIDPNLTPYQRQPEAVEIKHILSIRNILSSHEVMALKANISRVKLCNAINKVNERDAYVICLMMITGWTLENILNLRKTKEHYNPPYIYLDGFGKYIDEHITKAIDELCKNSKTYLFETSSGNKITRTQVSRNLKLAGRNLGLDFDLTPKVLQSYVIAYMSSDKRSELERAIRPIF
jgi:site-specific recombinase XerD